MALLNLWNLLNVISLILSLLAILNEYWIFRATGEKLSSTLEHADDYPMFDHLFSLRLNADFYLALILGVHWLKIFKYWNLNRTLLLLNKTLSTCASEILAFACIFLTIFSAYTELGWLLFGDYLNQWRSIHLSR